MSDYIEHIWSGDKDTPGVLLGCADCHAAKWVDGEDASEVTLEELHEGPTDHDMIWVQGWEGYGDLLATNPSPDEAAALAEFINSEIVGMYPLDAYEQFLDNYGTTHDTQQFERFTEAYAGEYESEQDYARDLADDLGLVDRDASWPNNFIDWKRAADELFSTDYWSAPAGGYHIYVYREV